MLQSDMTPETLVSEGAQLTGTESMTWADGNSVFITYWLGESDMTFRCAEIRAGAALNPSCWRHEVTTAAAGAFGAPVVRRISTRRRPRAYGYQQPYAYGWNPRVWVGLHR